MQGSEVGARADVLICDAGIYIGDGGGSALVHVNYQTTVAGMLGTGTDALISMHTRYLHYI